MALLEPRRRRAPATALAAAILVLTALVAAPPAVSVSRPDLKATEGSVSLTSLGDRVKGRFVVRNAGGSAARSSTAYVTIRQGGRYRYLTELKILRLNAGRTARYAFKVATPSWLSQGSHAVRVCLDVKRKVRESREGNNCRSLGSITGVPDGPIEYQPDQRWFVPGYYGWVPGGYDDSHATPSALFVWLHGCGGHSEFDIDTYQPISTEDYVMIAPTGRESGCWRTPASGAGDDGIVLSAIADVSERFRIDPERVVLGGYSSGGDLSYRVAYRHSAAIDAVLVANSAPFRDTGLSEAQALAAATTKFRVAHLAHIEDDVYPIGTVEAELKVLSDNGFPVHKIELPGLHYDANTDADIRAHLLPQVDP